MLHCLLNAAQVKEVRQHGLGIGGFYECGPTGKRNLEGANQHEIAIDVVATSDGTYIAVLYGRGTGAAPTTIHTSWTELACRLERVFSVPPERIREMEMS